MWCISYSNAIGFCLVCLVDSQFSVATIVVMWNIRRLMSLLTIIIQNFILMRPLSVKIEGEVRILADANMLLNFDRTSY